MSGELTPRDFELLNQGMRDLAGTIEALRGDIADTYVRKDVLEPRLEVIHARIEGVETAVEGHAAWLLWAQRIVIGAVITALIGLVIVSGGPAPG